MHLDKCAFSLKASHLQLNWYFRMKYPLIFNWENLTTQTILPSLLPAFRANDFDIPSDLILKDP